MITRHGKPVAELAGTAEAALERKKLAIENLKALRARLPKVSIEEILEMRDEGRKY